MNFKSSKKEAQRDKPVERAVDRAQSNIAMPESEGGRRIEQEKLVFPVIKKELDRAQSKEIAMPGCEGKERIEQAKLAFPGTKKGLDRA